MTPNKQQIGVKLINNNGEVFYIKDLGESFNLEVIFEQSVYQAFNCHINSIDMENNAQRDYRSIRYEPDGFNLHIVPAYTTVNNCSIIPNTSINPGMEANFCENEYNEEEERLDSNCC